MEEVDAESYFCSKSPHQSSLAVVGKRDWIFTSSSTSKEISCGAWRRHSPSPEAVAFQ